MPNHNIFVEKWLFKHPVIGFYRSAPALINYIIRYKSCNYEKIKFPGKLDSETLFFSECCQTAQNLSIILKIHVKMYNVELEVH